MAGVNRREFLAVAGASGIAGVAGCIEGLPGSSNQLQKLGMTSYVRGGAWITAYVDAAKYYAKNIGIDIEVRPNQQSANEAVQDIRDFVTQGYDGIIAGIWQTGAAKSAINGAMKQNVLVFPTNADTASKNAPMYTGSSNYEGGQKSAKQMVQALKKQEPNDTPWR